MNKNILLVIGLFVLATFSFVSCSESTGEVDPYANWDQCNQKYIDSIATVAKANMGEEVGKWKVLYSYKLDSLKTSLTSDKNNYVYCRIDSVGSGATPLFTDTAYVSYKGMLINGEIFDSSYKGTYNPDFAVPVSFKTGSLVTGFTTALQKMKVGDQWTIYIPNGLGYGKSDKTSIPGYSTLIFKVALDRIVALKPTGRASEE